MELPPELCCLKIIGFSKYLGSSLSLLPSLMHRLENLLVAIELKNVFSQSFAEGGEVTAYRVCPLHLLSFLLSQIMYHVEVWRRTSDKRR